MRKWYSVTAMIAFCGVAIVLFSLFQTTNTLYNETTSQSLSTQEISRANNTIIARENTHAGTTKWKIPINKGSSLQIQAYASANSVLPGQLLTFYVSTQYEGTHYALDIYRIGWYNGTGGRLMMLTQSLVGHAQGYYNTETHSLISCQTCYTEPMTGLVEAHWKPSYTLTVPADWPTGVYLAKFTDEHDIQTYAPFVVRGNPNARYLVCTADTTYAAYNDWGGYSLYDSDDADRSGEKVSLSRGMKVSFDRPYSSGQGASQVLVFEINALRWMERQGYDLSYITDIDLHESPQQLLQHQAYLSLGHDEYWSKEMRDGVEYARDHGVGLAFLGADTAYWQIRFEPDSDGKINRTLVCYKVSSDDGSLSRDPLYGKDNTRVTALWRDQLLSRPENALVGIMYSGLTHQRMGFAWHVDPQASGPLLQGTELQAGELYGCNYVGYEWDHVFPNGATPPGLQILATSPTVNNSNKSDFSNTTYYIAASGAFVFATGSIYWTMALDSYRLHEDNQCASQEHEVSGMQKLMMNVMDALILLHPTGQLVLHPMPSHPVRSRTEQYTEKNGM